MMRREGAIRVEDGMRKMKGKIMTKVPQAKPLLDPPPPFKKSKSFG